MRQSNSSKTEDGKARHKKSHNFDFVTDITEKNPYTVITIHSLDACAVLLQGCLLCVMTRSGLCLLVPIVALAVYQLAAGEYLGDGSGMDVTNSSNVTNFTNIGSFVPEGAVSTCCK